MNVGVVGNSRYGDVRGLLDRLSKLAPKLKFTIFPEGELAPLWSTDAETLNPNDGQQALDLLITFGGDGTLLRGARLLNGRDVPILGYNLGRVGFLNAAPPENMESTLEAFVEGEFLIDERRTLVSTVIDGATEPTIEHRALNDVVVHKIGVARVIQLRLSLDDEEIGQYSADGIIIATPTGSTAYSLSAGGPIVVPGVDALVVTAICAHTLAVRPIVIPGGTSLKVEHLPPFAEQVLISHDGQIGTMLEPGGTVVIRQAASPTRLVRFGKEGFFERVRTKLHWGDLSDRETGNVE